MNVIVIKNVATMAFPYGKIPDIFYNKVFVFLHQKFYFFTPKKAIL